MEMEEYIVTKATQEAEIFNKLIKSLICDTTWPFDKEQTPPVFRTVFEFCRVYISPVEILESIIKNRHSDPGFIIPFNPLEIARNFFGTLENMSTFIYFFCWLWQTENLPHAYIVYLMLFKKNPELLKSFDFTFELGITAWKKEFRLIFQKPEYATRAYQISSQI